MAVRSHHAATGYDLSIVGTVGLPANYGGFETLAEHLVRGLARRRRIQVFCTTKGRVDQPADHLGAQLQYVNWDANGWQSIPYDVLSMRRALPVSRTVLVLGVSGCLLLPLLRQLWPQARLVTNIDGLEWRREKWGYLARWVLTQSEAMAVRYSDAVVADNLGIAEYVQQTYGRASTLIAYGGDTEQLASAGEKAPTTPRDAPFDAGTYHFSVCRIEPENNIAAIMAAFASQSAHRLVLVGNWQASDYGRLLRAQYATTSNIAMLNPIYDRLRLDRLRGEALSHVHGHSAGGTNPSLVEAMCNGMAVLAFDVNYNRYTTQGQAFYWSTPVALSALLEGLSADKLNRCAMAMKSIADSEYTWAGVVEQYDAVLFPN